MINIVINDWAVKKIIDNALINYDINYKVLLFDEREINLEYVIYVLVGSESLRIAKLIRNVDWSSIIIILTSKKIDNYARLLIFDLVYMNSNYVKRITEDINMALDIVVKHNFFVFKYKNILYQVNYKDIIYIEKEALLKRCIIHTIDGIYYVYLSVRDILLKLDNNFFRCHQSCIINLNYVREIDLNGNKILFENGEYTYLLSDLLKNNLLMKMRCR